MHLAYRLVLTAAIGLTACGELSIPSLDLSPELPPAQLYGVRFEGFDRGARDVALVARRAQIDPETRVAHLEDVEIDLSARIGRGPLRVTAPAGELDLRTDRFRLTGGVEGSTRPGEAFTTDSVSYDESSGELFSDSRVELRRSNLYLTAARMRLDVEAGRVRLLGGVRARMQAR